MQGPGSNGVLPTLQLADVYFMPPEQLVWCRDDYEEFDDPDNAPMSVVKLQVGLLGTARELQRDLNRMGNSVDTSSPGGLHYLLQETVLALRRNPQYAMYGMHSLLPRCFFAHVRFHIPKQDAIQRGYASPA